MLTEREMPLSNTPKYRQKRHHLMLSTVTYHCLLYPGVLHDGSTKVVLILLPDWISID